MELFLAIFNWLKAKGNEPIAQWLTLIVLIATVCVAWWIGNTQNSINKKLEKIQDTVEIFAYPVSGAPNTNQPVKGYPWLLRVINVGNVQLYIKDYSVNGSKTILNNALLPAGQQQSAWYQIPLSLPSSTISPIHVTINATDKFKRLWRSETDIEYINSEWESTTHGSQLIK